jgi:hypothetical protein
MRRSRWGDEQISLSRPKTVIFITLTVPRLSLLMQEPSTTAPTSQQQEAMDDNLHKRQTTTIRANEKFSSNDASTDTQDMSGSQLLIRFKVFAALHAVRILLICLLLALFVVVPLRVSRTDDGTTGKTKQLNKLSTAPKPLPDLSKYENCTVSTPPARSEWTTKPLFFPSYPDSIDEKLLKSLTSSMTGLGAGAKSFYASSRQSGLRQCFGKTETAACLLIHPMVEMKPGPLSKTAKFAPQLVYLMRNPATAMPAFMNGKRIRYAKLPGQTPEDEWRKSRFMYLEGLWKSFKNQLKTWHGYTEGGAYYKVGLYLVHEHLMDPERGPAAVAKLATVLSEAGFPTAPKEDMACVWYKSVGGKAALEHYHKYRYGFDEYLPGYTKEQQAMLLQGLSELTEEYSSDAELVEILKEYHATIRDYTVDRKWVNKTATPEESPT